MRETKRYLVEVTRSNGVQDEVPVFAKSLEEADRLAQQHYRQCSIGRVRPDLRYVNNQQEK